MRDPQNFFTEQDCDCKGYFFVSSDGFKTIASNETGFISITAANAAIREALGPKVHCEDGLWTQIEYATDTHEAHLFCVKEIGLQGREIGEIIIDEEIGIELRPCDCYTRIFPPRLGHDDQCSLKSKEIGK